MLGDILFSNLVTHLVATIFVGDNHEILEIYLDCGPKQKKMDMLSSCMWFDGMSGQTQRENMFVLLLGTTGTDRISSVIS